MKKLLQVILTVVFVVGIWGIGFAAEKIVIEGSGDNQRLLRVLADVFEKKHPGKIIEIPESIGSSGGIKALENGRCDLARIARPLKNREKAGDLTCKVFASTPLVFFTGNNEAGVDNLTSEQVVNIFSGKFDSWSQLGGKDIKLQVFNREKEDSSRKILEEKIPGFKETNTMYGEIIQSTPGLIKIGIEKKNSIGYGPFSMVKGAGLFVLKLDGIEPSVESAQKGEYKLLINLAIVWKNGKFSGLAKDFVDFLFSAEAKKIILDNGGSPVN